MRLTSVFAICYATMSITASAGEVAFNTKETGFPALDYTAREVARDGSSPDIDIPGSVDKMPMFCDKLGYQFKDAPVAK